MNDQHLGRPRPKYNFNLLETPSGYSLTSGPESGSGDAGSQSTSAGVHATRLHPAPAKYGPQMDSSSMGLLLETPSGPSLTSEAESASVGESGSRVPHSGGTTAATKPGGPPPAGTSTGTGDCSMSTVTAMRSSSFGTSYHSALSSSSLVGDLPRPRGIRTPGTGSSSASRGLRTPGSARTPYTGSSMTSADHRTVLVALVEGRGVARGEIGMATMDLKRPVLTLSQFTDSQTYVKVMTKLNILQPLEILMPNSMCESGKTVKLFQLIEDHYQSTIASVPRKYFDENKGFQYVKQLCLPEFNTVEMEIRTKYYALSCTAALLKYIEFKQNFVYTPSSLKIVFKGGEQTTMIDSLTAENLQLVHNSTDPRSQHSLYGILNNTKTPLGPRLLRSNILQPPYNAETSRTRLDAVEELTENEELFHGVQSVLGRFLDVEHLLTLCLQLPKQETVVTAERRIDNIIQLKHTLEQVEPLQSALKQSKNTLLQTYYQILSDVRFELLLEKIGTVIHDDTKYQKSLLNMRTQKCFAIKPNINGLLDVARRMYSELVDDINDLVQQLGSEHGLPLKTAYTNSRGFYVQLFCKGKEGYTEDSLPSVAMKVTKNRSTLSFTTSDLIKMNDRVKLTLEEIYLMSNVVVTELLREICEHMGCLYKLTDCIAMLDMLVSFAHNCTMSEYVKPKFRDTLALKQCVHPILEKISVEAPVPNNVYAADDSNFVIITGPNMSGKSTYLRQIALLQVMAQIGSFVPAAYASFRITDQIFSRISTDDDIQTNSSTFVVEMKEANYIMQNATGSSLIIIDELGRGTSADEGVGICWATCEYLLRLKAFTFIATHFLDITKLDGVYPNVENYHFEVHQMFSETARHDKIIYTHTLSLGKTQEKHYGLQLADVCPLPRKLLDVAKAMTTRLDRQKKATEDSSVEHVKQRAVFRLGQRMLQTAHNSRLDSDSLRGYLKTLKQQYEMDLPANGQ